jgi:hypothetical protein
MQKTKRTRDQPEPPAPARAAARPGGAPHLRSAIGDPCEISHTDTLAAASTHRGIGSFPVPAYFIYEYGR